jgi:predicted phosphodiesterase
VHLEQHEEIMTNTAILSDIHGNYDALEAVLDDMEEVERCICIGDLVGYGAEPIKVLQRVREEKFDLVLKGNHDDAVINGASNFNPLARKSIDWTRQVIQEEAPDLISYIETLSSSHSEGRILYVHASPRDPLMEYLLPSDCFSIMSDVPEKIRENLDLVDHLCFFGHTHKPGIITEEADYLVPETLGSRAEFEEDKKYLVNVGSVGQPRDGDPRACYVTTDGDAVEYHKVEYDIASAQKKIRAVDALDNRLAMRLESGN